jgi:DNA-binding transcriptional LysR family regulator
LHLVAKHGSFTKAASFAGLTQSAITRQIQGMESRLEVSLLERTTRSVRPTAAGTYLLTEASKILQSVENSIVTLREQFGQAQKQIRVGVSLTISHAYLPGFFFAHQRHQSQIAVKVSHEASQSLLQRLEANELDLAVLCPPPRLPKGLKVTHRFSDNFTLITPKDLPVPDRQLRQWSQPWRNWASKQNWLLIHEESNTGRQLRNWLGQQKLKIEPAMQMDNFDLIINLVSLGLGVSLVPQRALALYGNRRLVQRIPLKNKFTRELVVVMRKQKPPEHLVRFMESILF